MPPAEVGQCLAASSPQPGEEVHLSSSTADSPVGHPIDRTPAESVPAEPISEPIPKRDTAPSTLMMEEPLSDTSVGMADEAGTLGLLTQSLSAKANSEAHWEAGLTALTALPEGDRVAAGKVAFYTQAASLPQFESTLAGLPEEQKPLFPNMIFEAKEAGALDGDELTNMVKSWSENHPEQAYLAQMSGFANYANDQLLSEAVKQEVGSLDKLQVGPREKALFEVSSHGDSYVRERNVYLSGAAELTSQGNIAFAQQLVDA